MAFGKLALCQRRMRQRIAAEQKKGGAHAFLPQRIENTIRRCGPRSVIEAEHDFSRSERQGLWKLLAPDARRARGVDAEHARGAERVGIAGTARGVLRPRRRGQRQGQRQRDDDGAGRTHQVQVAKLSPVPVPAGVR